MSLKATATSGVFYRWTGDLTSFSATETLTVDGNKDVTAWFLQSAYHITTTVSGSGKISPSGSVLVNTNGNKTFTFTPASGASILDVIVDGTSVGTPSSYTFYNVISDHTIEVKFSNAPTPPAKTVHNITCSADANVTISPSGPITVLSGSSKTISWTVEAGYEVKDVVIDGVSHPELIGAGSYTFTNVTSDHTIVVTSESHIFLNITIVGGEGYAEYSIDGGNTFTRYTEKCELSPGTDIILHCVCGSGFSFVRWEGSVAGTDETASINNVTSDINETLVLQKTSGGGGGGGGGSGSGGSGDNFVGSPLFIAIMAVIFAMLLIGLLLILLAAFYRGGLEVVVVNSATATIVGKNKARSDHAYKFSIEGTGLATYRVGDNQVWKEPVWNGGKYEIPKEDVTDTLTIKVR